MQAWMVKIAPTDDISIPLEYTVEWPIDKEVVFRDQHTKGTTEGPKFARDRKGRHGEGSDQPV